VNGQQPTTAEQAGTAAVLQALAMQRSAAADEVANLAGECAALEFKHAAAMRAGEAIKQVALEAIELGLRAAKSDEATAGALKALRVRIVGEEPKKGARKRA
jgi:hypothetical protein